MLSNSCEAAELVDLIVEQLETPEQKRLAVSAANIMVQKFRKDRKDPETDKEYWETCRYAVQELNLDVLWISALLDQMNEPVMTYFFDHEVEDSPEIALWQGLYALREHHLSEQYLALYEYAVSVRHLKPDGNMQKEYLEMREGRALTESSKPKKRQD